MMKTSTTVNYPFALSRSTHPPHDGDGLCGEEPRVADFIVHNAVKHFLLVVPGEGGLKQKCRDEKDDIFCDIKRIIS